MNAHYVTLEPYKNVITGAQALLHTLVVGAGCKGDEGRAALPGIMQADAGMWLLPLPQSPAHVGLPDSLTIRLCSALQPTC